MTGAVLQGEKPTPRVHTGLPNCTREGTGRRERWLLIDASVNSL